MAELARRPRGLINAYRPVELDADPGPAGRCVFCTARSHVRWQLPIDALLNRSIGGKAVLHVD